MKRQKPVQIEIRKDGKHWAVIAEKQTVGIAVSRADADNLEAVLRGLLKYTSRKLFRKAVKEALTKSNAPKASTASN